MLNPESNGINDQKPVLILPNEIRFGQWRGLTLPMYDEDVEVHFEKVMNMQLRDDDVILCAYPKSGTHWVWRILDMLQHKTAEYSERDAVHQMMDLQRVEHLNNMDSPRILSTHLPLTFLPRQVKDGRTKLVHVYRNPKAVMVSTFFHEKNAGVDRSLCGVEKMFSDQKDANNQNWFFWMDQVTEFERNNPDVQIHHVAYEDLKLNTTESIRELSKFLKLDVPQDLCQKIADAVSITRQRQEERKRADSTDSADFCNKFYRKGEINDWKNYLTVAQNERLDSIIADRAARCRFTRKYLSQD